MLDTISTNRLVRLDGPLADAIEAARAAGTLCIDRPDPDREVTVFSGISLDGTDAVFAQINGSLTLVRLS